jgi:hypothetical protein
MPHPLPLLALAAMAALMAVSAPLASPAWAQAPAQVPTGEPGIRCHRVTIGTGTQTGAGTANTVRLFDRAIQDWVALDHGTGGNFHPGTAKDFHPVCGDFLTPTPTRAGTAVPLIRVGLFKTRLLPGRDSWQVLSISVDGLVFHCRDRWLRPGEDVHCPAVNAPGGRARIGSV